MAKIQNNIKFIKFRMGTENSQSQKIKQRHKRFLKVFHDNYSLRDQTYDEIFGQVRLYGNVNTGNVEVLEKTLSFNSENQIERIVKTMQKRVTNPIQNLLQIYSIEYLSVDQFCGVLKSAKVYTEFLQKTLKSQLGKKRKTCSYLTQQRLLIIAVSLLNGIKYLHDEKAYHNEIRTQNILVDNLYHLKIIQKALLNPTNWEVVIDQQNGFKILKGKSVLLSPCILECLKERSTQLSGYDPFKADIYAIGMILLECCSLKKAESFYDYEQIKVKSQEIAMTIYQCRRKYSHNLMNIVEKMLEEEDELRPTAAQLMSQMEHISGDTIREMNTTLNESFLSETIRSYM